MISNKQGRKSKIHIRGAYVAGKFEEVVLYYNNSNDSSIQYTVGG